MDEHKLSEGSLKAILNGDKVFEPVMQLLGSKKINVNSSGQERYRIVLSDGVNSISYAMLTIQQSSGSIGCISNNSVIKVKKYISSTINSNMKVVLVKNLDVLIDGEKVGHVIGNPTDLQNEKNTFSCANTSNISSISTTNGIGSYTVKSDSSTNSIVNNTISNMRVVNPISSLTHFRTKWVIKARVASKTDMRTWSNSRGEGKFFSVDLIDKSGEIKCTAFRDMADKYFNYLQVGKVYYFSKCQLKLANKNSNQLKNDYEMTVNSDTIIEECATNDEDVPIVKYNFVPISTVAEATVGSLIDIIGVCKNVRKLKTITARTTLNEMKSRDIHLIDQSMKMVTLTLWGSRAEEFNNNDNPVVMIKGAKVKEFGGSKNLSLLACSQLHINPDIPECYRIKSWFNLEGQDAEVENISKIVGMENRQMPWMTFTEVKERALKSRKYEYYQLVGTILQVQSEKPVYKSCPKTDCHTKVFTMLDGMYRCEMCNREYPNFKYKLSTSMKLGDWNWNEWVEVFENEAEQVLGKTSEEVGYAMVNDAEEYAQIFRDVHLNQFVFKCRTKLEVYENEERLKNVVMKIDPINYEEYNSYLVDSIECCLASLI